MQASALHILARAMDPATGQEVRPTSLTDSPYGYMPSTASCIAYLTMFSILTAVHLGLGVRYKYHSAIATMVPGGLLEIIGWAGRYWSNQNLLIWDPFIMQICW